MIPHDAELLGLVGTWHQPWLSPIMIGLTRSGNIGVLVGAMTAGMVWMFRRSRRRAAWVLLFAGLAAVVLDTSIKFAVGRLRPDVAWRLIDVPPYPSFPSGHAMGSLAVYGLLGWLMARRAGLAIGAAIGVLIGVSRVYVGVHYPADVLAGLLFGTCILALAVKAAGPSSVGPASSPAQPSRVDACSSKGTEP